MIATYTAVQQCHKLSGEEKSVASDDNAKQVSLGHSSV